MNKYQKSLNDFMKTGEIEIELKHLSQRQLIRLVEDLQQRIDKAIEYIKSYNLPDDLESLSECPISVGELKELLSILRGENNEGE